MNGTVHGKCVDIDEDERDWNEETHIVIFVKNMGMLRIFHVPLVTEQHNKTNGSHSQHKVPSCLLKAAQMREQARNPQIVEIRDTLHFLHMAEGHIYGDVCVSARRKCD